MSDINFPIHSLSDLGERIAALRRDAGLKTTSIAEISGRSRDILYRLEHGEDVSVSSLLDILRAMGYRLAVVPARLPTLDEVQQRFADED